MVGQELVNDPAGHSGRKDRSMVTTVLETAQVSSMSKGEGPLAC
jgi:hypothetical protein